MNNPMKVRMMFKRWWPRGARQSVSETERPFVAMERLRKLARGMLRRVPSRNQWTGKRKV